MERRHLLLTSLAAFVATPLTATAQRGPRVPRVGVLGEGVPGGVAASLLETFRVGPRDLSYVGGQNVVLGVPLREGHARPGSRARGRAG